MTIPAGSAHPRITLVINPAAGRGTAAEVGRQVAAIFAAGAEVTELSPEGGAAGSVAALRRAAADRPDAVVVCGGDGMVHLAANVLAGGTVPLGIVPCGTGNDTAQVLGMDRDPRRAAQQLLAALAARSVGRIDLGRCDGPPVAPGTIRSFVGLLYAGFDSAVNDRANRMRRPRGRARYDVALAIEMIRLRPRLFRLDLDGRTVTVPAILVAVGNGPQYGGGKRMTPEARWDDSILDVTMVGPVSRMTLARLAPTLPRAGHIGHPRVQTWSGQRIAMDARDTIAYADGEPVGPLPIRGWVEPAALAVLMPDPAVAWR